MGLTPPHLSHAFLTPASDPPLQVSDEVFEQPLRQYNYDLGSVADTGRVCVWRGGGGAWYTRLFNEFIKDSHIFNLPQSRVFYV